MYNDSLRKVADEWKKKAHDTCSAYEKDFATDTKIRVLKECAEELNSNLDSMEDAFAEDRQEYGRQIKSLQDEIGKVVRALKDCHDKYLTGVEGTPCEIAARVIRSDYDIMKFIKSMSVKKYDSVSSPLSIEKLDKKVSELDEALLRTRKDINTLGEHQKTQDKLDTVFRELIEKFESRIGAAEKNIAIMEANIVQRSRNIILR